MELLREEYEQEEAASILRGKKKRQYQYKNLFIMTVVYALVSTGCSQQELMSNFIFMEDDQLVQYVSQYGMLFAGVLTFIIGSFIDTKNLKIVLVVLIGMVIALKIATFDLFNMDSRLFDRLILTFMVVRLQIYFVFQVTLFNWFSRKSLLFMNALFDSSELIPLIISRFFYFRDDQDVPKAVTKAITSVLLLGGIYLIWKHFTIDPVDQGILMNEQGICYKFSNFDHEEILKRSGLEQAQQQFHYEMNSENKDSFHKMVNTIISGENGTTFQQNQQVLASTLSQAKRQSTDLMKRRKRFTKNTRSGSLENDTTSYTGSEIRRVVYKNNGQGISVQEMFSLERVFKITLIAALVFIKYNSVLSYTQIYMMKGSRVDDEKQQTYNQDEFWTVIVSTFSQIFLGFMAYKFFAGRKMFIFLLILFVSFLYDMGILISLIASLEDDNVILIVMSVEVVLSRMLSYIGTQILPFDIGKILLLKQNRNVFGQVFGGITAFKYICDSILIQNFVGPLVRNSSTSTAIATVGMCLVVTVIILPCSIAIYREEQKEIQIMKHQKQIYV